MFAANYYLPAQEDYSATRHNDEAQPPAKKQCQSVSMSPRAARILGRKYALTSTCFKHVDIAINVGMVSTVDLILCDNRGTQLRLSYAMWNSLLEKRGDIRRLLEKSFCSPLWIQDLSVQVYTIDSSKMFKLSLSPNNYLYLMPATMDCLFNLEHCIEHMYAWLNENTHLVDIKVQNFVNVLRKKNITETCKAAEAIRESEVFDSGSLIDCELLACALSTIACNV